MNNVLDLFSGAGGFSSAFRDSSRWNVTTVEIEPEHDPDIQADIFNLNPSDFQREFDVILASPPCQYLNSAGNHDKWDFDRKEPIHPDSMNAVALFYHTIGLIRGLSPEYHYIENPRTSRIQWFIGKPKEWVTYCRYGKDYQKPTGFWGEHAPMNFQKCSAGANCHDSNSEDDGTSAVASMPENQSERSKVPYELSRAIREACEKALDGKSHTQSKLGGIGK